jgi:hypothetical protein
MRLSVTKTRKPISEPDFFAAPLRIHESLKGRAALSLSPGSREESRQGITTRRRDMSLTRRRSRPHGIHLPEELPVTSRASLKRGVIVKVGQLNSSTTQGDTPLLSSPYLLFTALGDQKGRLKRLRAR